MREINELHVPVDEPISMTMTSEDVIHDFYIPAFRVKKDVRAGPLHVAVVSGHQDRHLSPFLRAILRHGPRGNDRLGLRDVAPDYAAWLAGGAKNESMAQTGERLFTQLGCVTCHVADGTGRGPSLVGVYGKPEKLRDGDTRVVDDTLIRQAIVNPNSILLPNYPPIMPTFQGQINEEQVLQLIAYVKSLGPEERKTNAK